MTRNLSTSRRRFLGAGGAALATLAGGRVTTRASAATGNPLFETNFDSRERYGDAGTVVDDFEDLSRWTALSGGLAADSNRAYRGSQAARLSLSADSDSDEIVAVREFDGGIDLSDRDLSIALRLGKPPVEQFTVRATDGSGDSVEMERSTVKPLLGWFRVDLGITAESGSPDLSDVRRLTLTVDTDQNTDVLFWIDDLRATERADGGHVLITFDDGIASQYTRALPIMADRDVPAITLVNPARIGTSGHLSVSELREMRDAGWEVGSHGMNHRYLPDLSASEKRAEIEDAKRWLLDRGFEVGSACFGYPWGMAGPAGRDVVADHHYVGFMDGGNNHGAQLTGTLSVGRVFGEEISYVEEAVDLAAKYDQLLVLVYHGVGTDTGWISESDFRASMDYVANTDGVRAITPSYLLTELFDPPITDVEPETIPEAVAGEDGDVSLPELQRAVNRWKEEEFVPGTNGKKLDLPTLQRLVNQWKTG